VSLGAGSYGQRFSGRGHSSYPMLQGQAVNRDGTRRYRCPVQSKFAVARPPPVFGRLTRRLRARLNHSCMLRLRHQGRNPRSEKR